MSTPRRQDAASHIDRDSLLTDLAAATARFRYEATLQADALAATLGISHADFACLTLLFLEGPATAGRLGEVTGLSSGGVSGVIDRLERGGLVQREADPADRRRVVVAITPDQLTRLQEAFAPLPAAERAVLDSYPPAELALLLADAEERLAILGDETRRLRGEVRDAAPATEVRTFSTPLDGRRHARLEFVGGGDVLHIHGDPDLRDLFRAEFHGGGARAAVDEHGTVSIRSRSPRRGGPTDGTITLNAGVQWTLQFRGGGGRIEADLQSVPLGALEFVGGSGEADVTLGPPTGHVSLLVFGGARHVRFHRPAGTEARLSLRGMLSHLAIDGQDSGRSWSLHGSKWETPGHPEATDRFDITIRGGAVHLELDEF